jgi:hypothetical protein
MPDAPERDPVVTIWLEQPEEEHPMEVERFAKSWADTLRDRTRSEILFSIGAAVLFIALMGWRWVMDGARPHKLAWFVAAAVAAWSLVSLFWFRRRIWRGNGGRRDIAAAGLEYYRTELEQRSRHLRNAWVWHGPLFLACAILAALCIGSGIGGRERLPQVLPLAAMLGAWTVFGIRRRYREAGELQQEIREIDGLAGLSQGSSERGDSQR